jgi:hypothetical protein
MERDVDVFIAVVSNEGSSRKAMAALYESMPPAAW